METEADRLVRDMRSGGGPLCRLSIQNVVDIVVNNAPYGRAARDAYFARLREESDRRVPCEYD